MNPESDLQHISGTRKAAILMTLLSEEAASTLLHHLPEEDLQSIAHEVARLGNISKEVSMKVMLEYQQMTSTQENIAEGGQDVAKRMLVRAFGENGAQVDGSAPRAIAGDEFLPR